MKKTTHIKPKKKWCVCANPKPDRVECMWKFSTKKEALNQIKYMATKGMNTVLVLETTTYELMG